MRDSFDSKLDEDLFYLQRQIHVIQQERMQIQKETQILIHRVSMLKNQLNDLNIKCNLKMQIMNKRIDHNIIMREEEKKRLDTKYKQHMELENKKKQLKIKKNQ